MGLLPSHLKRQRGFTLVELSLVIAIISLVLAISVPFYAHQVARANLSKAVSTATRAQQYASIDGFQTPNQRIKALTNKIVPTIEVDTLSAPDQGQLIFHLTGHLPGNNDNCQIVYQALADHWACGVADGVCSQKVVDEMCTTAEILSESNDTDDTSSTETTDDTSSTDDSSEIQEWSGSGVLLKPGDQVRYNGGIYEVLQEHETQPDWAPDVAISLFSYQGPAE